MTRVAPVAALLFTPLMIWIYGRIESGARATEELGRLFENPERLPAADLESRVDQYLAAGGLVSLPGTAALLCIPVVFVVQAAAALLLPQPSARPTTSRPTLKGPVTRSALATGVYVGLLVMGCALLCGELSAGQVATTRVVAQFPTVLLAAALLVAAPASAAESLRASAAVARSFQLTRGARIRALTIVIALMAVYVPIRFAAGEMAMRTWPREVDLITARAAAAAWSVVGLAVLSSFVISVAGAVLFDELRAPEMDDPRVEVFE